MIVTQDDLAMARSLATMIPRPDKDSVLRDMDYGSLVILWSAYEEAIEVIRTAHHVLDQLVPGDERLENAIWQCREILNIQPEEPNPGGPVKVFHVHIDVADLLTWSDARFEEEVLPFLKHGESDTFTTVKQARTFLVREFARGVRAIRLGGEGCDNFDMKKGCLGHPVKDEHHGRA